MALHVFGTLHPVTVELCYWRGCSSASGWEPGTDVLSALEDTQHWAENYEVESWREGLMNRVGGFTTHGMARLRDQGHRPGHNAPR